MTPPESLPYRAGNGGASAAPNAGTCSGQSPPNLLLEYFFDLPDLFFNFPGPVFGFAFSLQVGIVRDLACLLFNFAFHFMKLAFNLILRTRAHRFSPYR